MNVTEMGRAGLTGMPGKVGAAAAQPISERTSLTREQIEALIGAILLVLAIYRFARMLAGVWRAGQGEPEADDYR
jgi:hypothetical protein